MYIVNVNKYNYTCRYHLQTESMNSKFVLISKWKQTESFYVNHVQLHKNENVDINFFWNWSNLYSVHKILWFFIFEIYETCHVNIKFN